VDSPDVAMLDVETAANLGNVVETLEDRDIRVVRLAHVAEHPGA
jgi:hypothetical protein